MVAGQRARLGLLALLAAAGPGCFIGPAYYGSLGGSPVARQIQSELGDELFDTAGLRLGAEFRIPPYENYSAGRCLWVSFGAEETFMPEDVRLFGANLGLSWSQRLCERGKYHRWLNVCAGADLSVMNLEAGSAADDWCLGGRAFVGLEYGDEPVMWFLQVRQRWASFDTDYGELDADGIEVILGYRFNALVPFIAE